MVNEPLCAWLKAFFFSFITLRNIYLHKGFWFSSTNTYCVSHSNPTLYLSLCSFTQSVISYFTHLALAQAGTSQPVKAFSVRVDPHCRYKLYYSSLISLLSDLIFLALTVYLLLKNKQTSCSDMYSGQNKNNWRHIQEKNHHGTDA